MRLRFLTSGESHGQALTGIIEGLPAGLELSREDVDQQLKRRQGGHGRGGRMKIESDQARILSGIRWGRTLGSPISLLIENKDWQNWTKAMSPDPEHKASLEPMTRPRPGHADLTGALKYNTHDLRDVLERSSARETAMRVALGAVAKKFLSEFGITVGSFVTGIGSVKVESINPEARASDEHLLELFKKAETSPVRCPDQGASERMVQLIDKAKADGNSLGGVFEVFVTKAPPGLGSHVHWDRRLEGRLAQALMSIQAIKGVEVGAGFGAAEVPGSEVMDEIIYSDKAFSRATNHSGGIEGGMTNGMPVVLRVAMKPIPTQKKPLMSVDIVSKEAIEASYERSDVCAVPAAGVIGEAMVALVMADAMLEKFGGDSMQEIQRNYKSYLEQVSEF